MGKEATSWDWLRDGVRKALPEFSLMERVENIVLAGMADVNYLIRGHEGWIELKAVALPVRETTPVLGRDGLNPDQINWHLRRQRICGQTWIFISAKPYRWLVNGFWAREVNGWTRDELCMKSQFWYDENWSEREWRRFINILGPGTRQSGY